MHFKDFITQQRVAIFVIGIAIFFASLFTSHILGFSTLWGELLIDLAASSLTIIFTALIIDYLGMREESNKTHNIASLAEDEIKASCFRIKWRLARFFGLERKRSVRDNISNRQEAKEYLDRVTEEVNDYLSHLSFTSDVTPMNEKAFPQYLDSLQRAQTELEQTLTLYQYALSYSLRERVLALRSELQIAERLLGFIDTAEPLNEANISLIRITAQSLYDVTEAVLDHDSRTAIGTPLHAKEIILN